MPDEPLCRTPIPLLLPRTRADPTTRGGSRGRRSASPRGVGHSSSLRRATAMPEGAPPGVPPADRGRARVERPRRRRCLLGKRIDETVQRPRAPARAALEWSSGPGPCHRLRGPRTAPRGFRARPATRDASEHRTTSRRGASSRGRSEVLEPPGWTSPHRVRQEDRAGPGEPLLAPQGRPPGATTPRPDLWSDARLQYGLDQRRQWRPGWCANSLTCRIADTPGQRSPARSSRAIAVATGMAEMAAMAATTP